MPEVLFACSSVFVPSIEGLLFPSITQIRHRSRLIPRRDCHIVVLRFVASQELHLESGEVEMCWGVLDEARRSHGCCQKVNADCHATPTTGSQRLLAVRNRCDGPSVANV